MSIDVSPGHLHDPEAGLKRHPNLEKVCDQLQAIMIGRAAGELLAKGLPAGATGLVELPAWEWRVPLIEVGRKGRTLGGGSALLLPIRRDYGDQPLLAVTTEGTAAVPYRVIGMGHEYAGTAQVVTKAGHRALAKPLDFTGPVFVGQSPSLALVDLLEQLRDEGVAARWRYLMDVEPHVRELVLRAHSHVSQEIGKISGIVTPMLDDVGIDQAVDVMMFGMAKRKESEPREERVAGSDSVSRLIELSLRPGCFQKVDPLKFMTTHLRRDAEARIRAMIGDPHIGPKVRKVAMLNPTADLGSIVEEYRKVYPGDRLSLDRAEEAMSASADAAARTVPLDDHGGW